jgi:hypothetical protein
MRPRYGPLALGKRSERPQPSAAPRTGCGRTYTHFEEKWVRARSIACALVLPCTGYVPTPEWSASGNLRLPCVPQGSQDTWRSGRERQEQPRCGSGNQTLSQSEKDSVTLRGESVAAVVLCPIALPWCHKNCQWQGEDGHRVCTWQREMPCTEESSWQLFRGNLRIRHDMTVNSTTRIFRFKRHFTGLTLAL